MPKIVLEFDHCVECPHHKVIHTPDPTDWFNDDDCALVCTKVKNRSKKSQFEYKAIDVVLRPYEVKKCKTPDWCPLEKEDALTHDK